MTTANLFGVVVAVFLAYLAVGPAIVLTWWKLKKITEDFNGE